jgi:predicted peptidase
MVKDAAVGDWLPDRLQGLPCRVLLPARYEPAAVRYPLVVFLHGSAERGDDTVSHLGNGVRAFEGAAVRERFPCIVVAPQCPKDDTFGGSWYGGSSRTQRAVVEMVRELGTRRSVDARRVYLIGFSMGAIGAWDVLARYRELFAAAVPISGDLEPSPDAARALGDFPLWGFHGERDDIVSNVNTRAMFGALREFGAPARYTEFEGVGHEAWRPAFEMGELYGWLFSQRLA